jgi:hypothetical protein
MLDVLSSDETSEIALVFLAAYRWFLYEQTEKFVDVIYTLNCLMIVDLESYLFIFAEGGSLSLHMFLLLL